MSSIGEGAIRGISYQTLLLVLVLRSHRLLWLHLHLGELPSWKKEGRGLSYERLVIMSSDNGWL